MTGRQERGLGWYLSRMGLVAGTTHMTARCCCQGSSKGARCAKCGENWGGYCVTSPGHLRGHVPLCLSCQAGPRDEEFERAVAAQLALLGAA